MYRVMMISLLAALTYLGTAPTDIDARCGGGNGGIFGRGRIFGGRLFNRNRQSSQGRIEAVHSVRPVNAADAGFILPGQTVVPVTTYRSSGNCPGGVCPIR